MSHDEHRSKAPGAVGFALLTISDTRTIAADASGSIANGLPHRAGHAVREYRILKDEPEAIRRSVLELAARADLRAIVLSGGTGISRRDRTCEAVTPLLETRLDGFGELFRALSYQ